MIPIFCEQRSDEWFACRLGIPTASSFDNIVTSKGEPSKQADKYMSKLVTERITGQRVKGFENDSMLRGAELEPEAVGYYELRNNVETQPIGFAYKNDLKKFGASPDRLIGEDGCLEIKCPEAHTHIEYLRSNKLPTEYIVQVQGQMYVTGRKWTDFMSFYPGLPPFIIRVHRDDLFIERLEQALIKFCLDLDQLEQTIRKIGK